MKQRRILLTLLLLFSFNLLKPQPVLDSISVITESPGADTIKIKRLLGLYHQYKVNEPQQALIAAESAGRLANEKNLDLFKEVIHAAEVQRQRSQKNIFIAGFILVFVLSFIMLKLYRDKNKSNRKLSETLEHLEKTQSQLIHQEKMASLGMLTAGIAHEIQNPLNFVTNFSDSSLEIIKELGETSDEREKQELMNELIMNMEKISSHGKRADNIIKSMLRHSHGNPEDKRPAIINRLCDEFLMLAYHSIRASHPDFNCAIEKKYQEDMPKVNLMAQEITRVLLNLFTNAFHALKERREKEPGFSAVITVSTLLKNDAAEIRIRDNGTGIPKSIKDKIFLPFFTTKKSGEGTGLGLSISHDIIKAHGGELLVNSKEGEFTEFCISLPL